MARSRCLTNNLTVSWSRLVWPCPLRNRKLRFCTGASRLVGLSGTVGCRLSILGYFVNGIRDLADDGGGLFYLCGLFLAALGDLFNDLGKLTHRGGGAINRFGLLLGAGGHLLAGGADTLGCLAGLLGGAVELIAGAGQALGGSANLADELAHVVDAVAGQRQLGN